MNGLLIFRDLVVIMTRLIGALVEDFINQYLYIIKPGTTSTTDVLELERFIYYDQPDLDVEFLAQMEKQQ